MRAFGCLLIALFVVLGLTYQPLQAIASGIAEAFEEAFPNPLQYASQDRETILNICAKYHHCKSEITDQLHCYQLESQILSLKQDSIESKSNIGNEEFDSDLGKLKRFGTARRKSNVVDYLR